jgi:hypothetical protein
VRDPRWAALWGWSPIVALEASSAAHVDVLAAVLIVVAVIVAARRKPIVAGLLLGAAASVKLLPLLLLPAFVSLRRRDPRTPLVAVGLALLAIHRHERAPIAVTCCWLYGAALLLTTPTYPWYGLPLIVLAVLAGRFEWLVVPVAAYLAYAASGHDVRQQLVYLAAAVIVATTITLRYRSTVENRLDATERRYGSITGGSSAANR